MEDYSKYVRLGYVNSNINLHREVIKSIRHTFGDVSFSCREIRLAYETYFTGILGKIYVKVFGFSPKSHTEGNFHLPDFILKLRDPYKIGEVLSQVIDDEGSFNQRTLYIGVTAGRIRKNQAVVIRKGFRNINIQEKYMPNLLKDIKLLCRKIGIKVDVKKPNTYIDKTENSLKMMWYIVIQGPKNLLKIKKYCRLKKKCLTKKFFVYINWWERSLKAVKKIEMERGFFTVGDIAAHLQVSMGTARNIILYLKRDEMIELFERGKYKKIKGIDKYIQAKFRLNAPIF